MNPGKQCSGPVTGEGKLSSVSRADCIEKMGEFWDQHDFTDFDDPASPDVDFTLRGDRSGER